MGYKSLDSFKSFVLVDWCNVYAAGAFLDTHGLSHGDLGQPQRRRTGSELCEITFIKAQTFTYPRLFAVMESSVSWKILPGCCSYDHIPIAIF